MIWRLVVLGGVCVLLLRAEARSRGGRTVTFHRTQQDGSQGQARARARRDITSSSSGTPRPSHGPPFTSCRTPLTPAEHKVLDANTHEVRFCLWVVWHCSEAEKSLVPRQAQSPSKKSHSYVFYLTWKMNFWTQINLFPGQEVIFFLLYLLFLHCGIMTPNMNLSMILIPNDICTNWCSSYNFLII